MISSRFKLERFVYLAYLGMLFFQPFFDREFTWQGWLFTFGLIAAFLPLYFASFTAKNRRKIYFIIPMVGLGLVGIHGFMGLFNTGATTFFVYASASLAYALRPRQAIWSIVGLMLCMVTSFFLSPFPLAVKLYIYIPAFVFVPMVGGLCLFEAEKERGRSKLKLAHQEIEQLATIAERERIARDLHDLLGHTLSLITLKAELAYKVFDKDELKAKQEIKEVEHISREALAEVRAVVTGYRAKGLLAEIANAKRVLEAADVSFSFAGDYKELNPLYESALSLVLREAVTNIVRHARASRVSVELKREKHVSLEILDNGVGMQGTIGNGLRGIRERVEVLGGRLQLGAGGSGFSLRIDLPSEVEGALQKSTLTTGWVKS